MKENKKESDVNEKELESAVGGVETGEYKYIFTVGDSFNCKEDGSVCYVVKENVKTNDDSRKIKCNYHIRGEGFRPSPGKDDYLESASFLISLYRRFGGFIEGM